MLDKILMGGMSSLLSKFSFEPEKIQGKLWLVVLAVWLMLVVCTITSIYARPSRFTSRQKLFWLLAVILVPGLGVLAYLPFSYRSEGFNFMKKPKPTTSRKSPSPSR